MEGCSHHTTQAAFIVLPEPASQLAFRYRVPAACTIAQLEGRLPSPCFDAPVRLLLVKVLGRRRANLTRDAAGPGLHQFERGIALPGPRSRIRRRFVKLHALVTVRAGGVLRGHRNPQATVIEAPTIPGLGGRMDADLSQGNVAVDNSHRSRSIAQGVPDYAGRPGSVRPAGCRR